MLEAAKVILELHRKNLVDDVSSYEAVIFYFVKHWEIEKAFTLYEESQNRGIWPNSRTRNHLIDGLFREGQINRAKMILGITIKEGLRPNRATYTATTSGLAKGGQLPEAFGLFDSMILRELSSYRMIHGALFLMDAVRLETCRKLRTCFRKCYKWE
ncbi:hypothetical protein HAX54_043331 [Datura stramonium]|uniref:Pentatricopeptide repeat-containing protein n=1 Tax=Datura stramonium TaxID=4076 RepID=A0ABS8SNI2_DATST|nr:hypothetical protein [Datura stramonium]